MIYKDLTANYDHGFIGNCTSGALINEDTSIEWLCLPYFDSPSVFAKLLDEKKGGFFKIEAYEMLSITREYLHNTAIIRTTIETQTGVFTIDDYMPKYKPGGHGDYCPSEVQRYIRVRSGKPRIRVIFQPAPNYAADYAECEAAGEYIKVMSKSGDYDSFYLYSNGSYSDILGENYFTLDCNIFLLFSYHEKIGRVDEEKIYYDYQQTKTYWLEWSSRTMSPGLYKDYVIRSAITLKMLTFQKTGAVLAALTTSLPEIIGHDRNWDYRYCWVRDAAMTIDVYTRIGHEHSALRFMNFIIDRLPRKNKKIGVLYGINHETELEESELKHLAGYLDSKPVRIGNQAYIQKQNDLYGELIETLYTYFIEVQNDGSQLNEEIWTVVRAMAREAISCWREADKGIWEMRGEPRHFVHSKLMNWVALDRACKIAEHIGKNDLVPIWRDEADKIKSDIIKHGWNDKVKSFTMYYGSENCDAANLLMLHYGFLPADDDLIVSTVNETYRQLVKNNFCFRYLEEDDFGEPENTFTVCSFWMVNALVLTGQKDKGRLMFENIIAHSNKFLLFSEDISPESGRLTGNFPQAYSHLALIQSALILETDYHWSDDE